MVIFRNLGGWVKRILLFVEIKMVIYGELVEQVFNLIFPQRYQDRGRQGQTLTDTNCCQPGRAIDTEQSGK